MQNRNSGAGDDPRFPASAEIVAGPAAAARRMRNWAVGGLVAAMALLMYLAIIVRMS